ncbi:MAG: hypothetical protein N2692_01345 [Patescibacteria group bacterium]|jgi:hypothetical protein|nr:hypothetical protein [Patescibacteria group bacterium]
MNNIFKNFYQPMTCKQALKTFLAYIALLLAQFLIEYCFMILAIFYSPRLSYWFASKFNLKIFLFFSGIISLLLVFEALKEGRRER